MGRILDPDTGQPYAYFPPPEPGSLGKRPDDFALPHVLTFASLLNSAYRTYYQQGWDVARKKDPHFALVMRNDCFLMGLMQERVLAVTGLPWHLEVEDEKDERQRFVRDHLTKTIRHGWRFREMRYNLIHERLWYGRAAVQPKFYWTVIDGVKTLQVQDWLPVNGDKIDHTWDHVPTINVNTSYTGELGDAELIYTDYNRAVVLKGTWAERFLIETHHQWDADFLDGALAAEAIHGVGVRSAIFFWDWIRLEWVSKVSDYMDRVGLGLTVWYYELGNDASYQEVKKCAEQQSNKVNVLVPRSLANKGQGLERIETPVAGAEAITKIVEHLEEYIRHFVTGQSMSTGGQGGELGGTGRAQFAESTKSKIAEHDAAISDEALTGGCGHFGLVSFLQFHTFPATCPGRPGGFPVRFVTDVEDPEAKEKIEAIQAVVQMGVPVRADDARSAAGISKPTGDDELIPGMIAPPGGEEPGQEGAPGEGPANPIQHGPKGGVYEVTPSGNKRSVAGGGVLTNRPGVHARGGDFKAHGGSGLHGGGGKFAMRGRPARFMKDAKGHEHKGKGPGGGQFGTGGGGGSSSSSGGKPKPTPAAPAPAPSPQQQQAQHDAVVQSTGATPGLTQGKPETSPENIQRAEWESRAEAMGYSSRLLHSVADEVRAEMEGMNDNQQEFHDDITGLLKLRGVNPGTANPDDPKDMDAMKAVADRLKDKYPDELRGGPHKVYEALIRGEPQPATDEDVYEEALARMEGGEVEAPPAPASKAEAAGPKGPLGKATGDVLREAREGVGAAKDRQEALGHLKAAAGKLKSAVQPHVDAALAKATEGMPASVRSKVKSEARRLVSAAAKELHDELRNAGSQIGKRGELQGAIDEAGPDWSRHLDDMEGEIEAGLQDEYVEILGRDRAKYPDDENGEAPASLQADAEQEAARAAKAIRAALAAAVHEEAPPPTPAKGAGPDRHAMPKPPPAKPKRRLRDAVADVVRQMFGRKKETKEVAYDGDGRPKSVTTTTEHEAPGHDG